MSVLLAQLKKPVVSLEPSRWVWPSSSGCRFLELWAKAVHPRPGRCSGACPCARPCTAACSSAPLPSWRRAFSTGRAELATQRAFVRKPGYGSKAVMYDQKSAAYLLGFARVHRLVQSLLQFPAVALPLLLLAHLTAVTKLSVQFQRPRIAVSEVTRYKQTLLFNEGPQVDSSVRDRN